MLLNIQYVYYAADNIAAQSFASFSPRFVTNILSKFWTVCTIKKKKRYIVIFFSFSHLIDLLHLSIVYRCLSSAGCRGVRAYPS